MRSEKEHEKLAQVGHLMPRAFGGPGHADAGADDSEEDRGVQSAVWHSLGGMNEVNEEATAEKLVNLHF